MAGSYSARSANRASLQTTGKGAVGARLAGDRRRAPDAP
jgi:hypothetical protein